MVPSRDTVLDTHEGAKIGRFRSVERQGPGSSPLNPLAAAEYSTPGGVREAYGEENVFSMVASLISRRESGASWLVSERSGLQDIREEVRHGEREARPPDRSPISSSLQNANRFKRLRVTWVPPGCGNCGLDRG